jgi:uracil-DNA glycosylase family 4
MESGTKNRLRLWLRSERAFGLSAVPLPRKTQLDRIGGIATPRHPVVPDAATAREADERTIARQAQNVPRADLYARVAAPTEMAPAGGLIAPPATEPFVAPLLSRDEKVTRLAVLDESEVRGCTRCRLNEGRSNTVFGEGDPDAQVFFIGEGPGENEDLQGRPFVGRAGEMLNKWIAAMGLRREQVYIANIVKCRPPNNRVPMPDEVATCTPYLERQLEIIRPRVIVTLGLPSLKYMTGDPKLTMGRSRGHWRDWRGIKLMPTFHPAYVLRQYTDETRAAVWSDLQTVMKEIGLPLPGGAKKNNGR